MDRYGAAARVSRRCVAVGFPIEEIRQLYSLAVDLTAAPSTSAGRFSPRGHRHQTSLVLIHRPIPSTIRQPSGLWASAGLCCVSCSQSAARAATFAVSTVVLIARACRVGASQPGPSV